MKAIPMLKAARHYAHTAGLPFLTMQQQTDAARALATCCLAFLIIAEVSNNRRAMRHKTTKRCNALKSF